MSAGPANGVILLRPLEGKRSEVDAYLSKTLQDIRNNVAGVVLAYHFWATQKNQFVVVESFESVQAMFEYGNSKYHEGLVSEIVTLVEQPMEAFSDQDSTDEMEKFRKTDQASHFQV